MVRLMSEEEGSSRLNETPDLLILSNDIPTSPTEELIITGEEEDDPGQSYNTRCILVPSSSLGPTPYEYLQVMTRD